MKKGIIRLSIVLSLRVVFICSSYSQQVNNIDTIRLKEIAVTWERTIDTTGLKIQSVLKMEKEKSLNKKEGPCGISDFMVLYNDFSALYFNMGCVWDFQKISWARNNDTLFFYSQEIGRDVKQKGLTQTDQIIKYVLKNGKKIHVGSIGSGFDYLIFNSSNYYLAFNDSKIVTSYRFKEEKEVTNCDLQYYYQAIRTK